MVLCQSVVHPNISALTARHGHRAANTAGGGLNRDSKAERQRRRERKKKRRSTSVACYAQVSKQLQENGGKSPAIAQQH